MSDFVLVRSFYRIAFDIGFLFKALMNFWDYFREPVLTSSLTYSE
jgi:hypothetical protein